MNDIFLSENERNKLRILETILRSDDQCTINSIKSSLGFSYSKSKYLITELENELKTYFCFQLIDDTGRINKGCSRSIVIDYRIKLLKNSLAYQLIFNYLTKLDYTFDQLCKDCFISRASVFRKLKPLKDYLEKYDIKMKLIHMELIGDESIIRTLLFNMFWLIDRGAEIAAFACLSPQVYRLSTNWSENISMGEVRLFLSIATCRYQRKCFIDTDIFLEHHRPELELSVKSFMRESVPRAVLDNELSFFGYFFTYQNLYFDPQDTRITFLVESYRETKTDTLASRFLEMCSQHFRIESLPLDERKLLYINVLNTFNWCVISRKPLPSICDLNQQVLQRKAALYEYIVSLIRRMLMELADTPVNHWMKKCINKLAETCFMLLSPYFNERPNKKLQVVVKYDPNFFWFVRHMSAVKKFHSLKLESKRSLISLAVM